MLFTASTAIEFGPAPTRAPGTLIGSPRSIVFVTLFVVVSITEMLSL